MGRRLAAVISTPTTGSSLNQIENGPHWLDRWLGNVRREPGRRTFKRRLGRPETRPQAWLSPQAAKAAEQFIRGADGSNAI
jgi:hypothetical protein